MQLPENPRFRALIIGWPKVGKSGALISLLKAGFRVFYHDFDGNPEVLKLAGEHAANLVYLPYEDKIRPINLSRADVGQLAGTSGEPKAYYNYMNALETGNYVSPDGKTREKIPTLYELGSGDIVVTDSLTREIDAVWRRFLHTKGSVQKTKRDWGVIVDELSFAVEMINAQRLACHTVTIAHLQLVGADELEEDDKSGKRQELIEHNNEIKSRKAELLGPRLFPRAVTKAQSENIAGKFPIVLPVEVDDTGRRIFNLNPRKELPVALPALGKLPKTLPIESGLLDIFAAVTGLKAPPTT